MLKQLKRAALSPRPLSLYHERTRRRGVHPIVYWVSRAILEPAVEEGTR